MNLSVETTVPAFNQTLGSFIVFQRVTVPVGLRFQGRLLTERLITLTPPRTKAQGQKAVERDIKRLFLGLNRIQEAEWQALGGDQVVRLFATKFGVVYGVEKALFRPDAGLHEMWPHHQKFRDKRGRVSKGGTYTRDIGRWKFIDQMAVSAEALRDYIKYKKGLVGRGKGGWAAACVALGGKPAGWVSAWQSTGTVEDKADSPSPSIRIVNNSEWASGGDDDRIVANAIASRTRDMLKYIAIQQAQAARKAGFK